MGQGTTTSALTGFVTDTAGKPLAGASVVAVDTNSGSRYVATTRENGQYNLTGMRAGGPYTLTVTSGSMPAVTKDGIVLELGQTSKTDVAVSNDVVKLEAVSVTDSQDPTFASTAMSNSLTLNSQEVMQIASVRRDIQDLQNLDPRAVVMQVGPSDSQYTVSFDGQNPRENLLLIDGVSANDNFGLNSNGVAGFRNPVPPEWIQSFSLDLNPYDLIYSGFSGGVTDIEIKSGTNEFHGSIYRVYTGTNFRGPDPVVGIFGKHEPVNEWTTGATVGGPIIKNKLFFFLGYDAFREIAAPAVQNFLPDNSLAAAQAAVANGTLTSANAGVIDQIIQHTQSAYGYNPGTTAATNHIWQQSFVGKIDWNINDAQKFEFTFRHTDGEAPNFYQYTGSFETSLSGSWYNTHRTDQSYTAKLESDWSQILPNFHTEIEGTYKRYNGTAELNSADFPAVQINSIPGSSLAGGSPPYELFLGQSASYQDNNIYTWEQEEHVYGEYSLGAHTIKFGVQFDRTGYTDTFIPNILGTYVFNTPAQYLAGTPTFVQQEATYPGYTLGSDVSHYHAMMVSPLLEDIWRPSDALTVTAGIRWDYMYEPQKPPFSSLFYNAYGYRNNTNADGTNVFSPRVGFNYNLPTERKTQIRGGAGLIVGSFPTVWYENSFNNAGQLNTVSTGSTSQTLTTPVVSGYTFNGVNSPSLIGKVAPSSSVPSFDVIDPHFQLPSNWKENIAIDHELPFWHMIMTFNADFTQVNKDVKLLQLNLARAADGGPALTPDGAIRYAGNITPGYSSTANNKDANGNPYTQFNSGATSIFNGTTSGSSATVNANKATGAVYYLTNTDKGGSQTYAINLHTPFVDGWKWQVGYAHTHATQVDPSPSSVASSGFLDLYGKNPNDDVAYRSQYATPDKVVVQLTKKFNFFKMRNADTEISAQFIAQTGQAYSYVFKGDANGDGITSNDLFYVPNGANDPKVTWASSADQTAFQGYLAQHSDLAKYAGQLAPRNAFYAPWQRTVNIHFEQEVPMYGPARLVLFADCFNFANLLNKNWGIVDNFDNAFGVRTVVGTQFNPAGNGGAGQYVYTFNAASQNSPTIYPDMSRYNIQIGARIEF